MLKPYQKILLFLFFLYSFLGFILLPYIVKPQLKSIIEAQTHSKVKVESVSFNPFIFKMGISGIKLTNLEGEQLFSLGSISANIELYSLFFSTIHLKELSLENPEIFVVHNEDKSFNLLSIIKENKETKEKEQNSSPLPRIKLDTIRIIDGVVSYEDFTRDSKFDFVFERIGFELKDVDTNDFNASDAKLRFYSALGDGGFIDFKTNILGFSPLIVEGSVDFEASKLYTQWRYIKDSLNLEIADGKLSFHTNYYVNLDDLNATSLDEMSLHLSDLRVKPKDKYKDVLNLQKLDISGVRVKPLLQEVKVDTVALDSLYVKAIRDTKGEIDWVKFIEFKSEKSDEKSEEKNNSKPWKLRVDDLKLTNIQADFYDKKISPQVDTSLNKLNIYAQNISLAGITPLEYQIDMRLNEKFKCEMQGDLAHQQLDLNVDLQCSDFNLVHYRPYIDELATKALQTYNVKLVSSNLGFDTKVNVKDINDEIVIHAKDANLHVRDFKLNKKSTGKRIVSLKEFAVKGLNANTKKRNVDIAKVSLDWSYLNVAKLENGVLSLEDLVVPKAVEKSTKKDEVKKSEDEYKVHLKHFALNNATVDFRDKTFEPSVQQKIDKIYLNAYDIDSLKYSWFRYAFSARVNSQGYIKSKGGVRHTPIKQKGSFEIQNLSLAEINPYLDEKAYIRLDDGFLNLKTKTQYSKAKKAPDLKVQGSFNLESIFVNDTRDERTLLSFNEFGFKSFTFEMQPNRLYVDEATLDSFYVDALIDENKQMNLASLMKPTKENVESIEIVDENLSQAPKEEFPFKIMKINIHDGSAKFADYSIPIKFRTNIHDLNGQMYALSNQKDETSYIDIIGEIDKYGATSIKGSLDSNPKNFTDIAVSFKNLSLSSMSGYSASFAGHEIDDGKLFLNLNYNILDSNLKGENSIIVKKIKLGKEFEDENVTSLPLGFVIALLEDSEGIIDIDMPVDGDIDNPDFKYGELVLKTLGNLIVKAVASPFKFLGEAMGIDADSLSSIDFKAGAINITPPEREKLDNVAKMMIKRPKIVLKISGAYDDILDKRAIQLEKLITIVVQKSGIKNRENHESVMSVDLLEEIYEDLKDDDKLEKIEESLEKEYKGDALERAYKRAITIELLKLQEVSIEEMKALAFSRAKVSKSYLVDAKAIDTNRIIITETVKSEADETKLVKTKLEIDIK